MHEVYLYENLWYLWADSVIKRIYVEITHFFCLTLALVTRALQYVICFLSCYLARDSKLQIFCPRSIEDITIVQINIVHINIITYIDFRWSHNWQYIVIEFSELINKKSIKTSISILEGSPRKMSLSMEMTTKSYNCTGILN